jgi:UDP-2,3-diacylglucosamine pyrophosphatase LpxH
MEYVRRFEQAAAHAARQHGYDGVVCGHIHRPEIRHINGMLYCNDGDWVDSCTTLVETHGGALELYRWAQYRAATPPAAATVPARTAA